MASTARLTLGFCLAAIAMLGLSQPSAASLSADSCKKCHTKGKVAVAKFSESAHGGFDCTDCHEDVSPGHARSGDAGETAGCATCHDDILGDGPRGVHIELDDDEMPDTESCLMCHEDFHHQPRLVSCEGCHDDVPESLEGSEHWKNGAEGEVHRVGCVDCHTDFHNIRPASERGSHLSREKVHEICAACHDDAGKPAMNPITGDVFVPVASYLESVHGDKLGKVPGVANCTDCHGHHSFRRILDPSSTLNRTHIIETCGKCHQGKLEDFRKGEHGQKLAAEAERLAQMDEATFAEFAQTTPLSDRPPICTSCHTSHSIRRADHLGEFDEVHHLCSQCHAGEVEALAESIHREVRDPDTDTKRAVRCQDCHTDYHNNRDIRAGDSAFNKRNLAEICARCHNAPVTASETGDRFDPITSYKQSVHGRGVFRKGLYFSAGCVDCHGSHDIFPLADGRSTLHHRQLAETCGNPDCHVGIHDSFLEGTHGQLYLKEQERFNALAQEQITEPEFKGPVCISCHVSHEIRPTDEPDFYAESMEQCGHCHPLAMATYKRSYHGKAALLGSTDVASCHDCHGSHVNPRVTGPDGLESPENALTICQTCHERATIEMVSYINHLEIKKQFSEAELSEVEGIERQKLLAVKILRLVRFSMEGLLLSVFVFFGIHTILWFIRGMADRFLQRKQVPLEQRTEYYVRIDRYNRIIHVFVVLSFMGLALTGLPIKYPEHAWSREIFDVLDAMFQGNGGQVARLFHRVFAIITFGYLFFHLAYIFWQFLEKRHEETMARMRPCPVDRSLPPEARGWGWYLRCMGWLIPTSLAYIPVNLYLQVLFCLKAPKDCKGEGLRGLFGSESMLPRFKDAKDLWANIKWFLWLGPKPKWDTWTYYEKFDYWAVFWGVAIIGSTGLCMWFKEFFTATLGLPGWIINVAMEVHSHEALLAIGFIFSIHFFNGHLRPGKFPMDRVIFMGAVNRHELEEERPEQYERLVASGTLEDLRTASPPMWLRVVGTVFGTVALTVGIIIVFWIFRMELGHIFSPG